MSKLENTIVGILLGVTCAWLSFVACWWTAAMVHMYLGGISLGIVIASALTGLLIGIVLDLLYLRSWIRKFYTANLWFLAVIYAALCVVAVASFMGIPVGTFALGLLAGAYAGRREIHNPPEDGSGQGLRGVAFFAALMTAGTALPIGIMALREESVVELFGRFTGTVSGVAGIVIVCLLCTVLFGVQYWCTIRTGRLAQRIGTGRAGAGGASDGSRPKKHTKA